MGPSNFPSPFPVAFPFPFHSNFLHLTDPHPPRLPLRLTCRSACGPWSFAAIFPFFPLVGTTWPQFFLFWHYKNKVFSFFSFFSSFLVTFPPPPKKKRRRQLSKKRKKRKKRKKPYFCNAKIGKIGSRWSQQEEKKEKSHQITMGPHAPVGLRDDFSLFSSCWDHPGPIFPILAL